MLATILSWITGSLTGALERAYKAKLDAQNEEQRLIADTAIADIKAQIEANREAAQIRRETAGFWEMRVATVLVVWPLSIHLALVVYDTINTSVSLGIPALPHPMDDWEAAIILSLFGLQGATKGFTAIASAIRGRR